MTRASLHPKQPVLGQKEEELTHVAQDSSGRPNLDMNLNTSMGSPPSQPAPKPS